MTKTFKQRAATIADHASNPRGALGEGVEFLRGLDETERQCKQLRFPAVCFSPNFGLLVFRAAHDSAKASRTWLADVKKS